MLERFEGTFLGLDQIELFYQTWMDENPRGTIVITHGMAEHSECYHGLAKILAQEGWQVIGWDLRGHGRSEGKRGYAKHLSEFEEDLSLFMNDVIAPSHKRGPLVMFAHSMGGTITLRYIINSAPKIDALVLSCPALGLSMQVPKIKEAAAKIANRWMPTLTLYNEIKYRDLSRDEEMQKLYPKDTLRHDKVSPGIFLSMLESFEVVKQAGDKIKMPTLMQLSGDDRLVSSEAARAFFETLPNKKNQLVLYPESLHEIYNDLDRNHVIADLKKFINPLLGSSGGAS